MKKLKTKRDFYGYDTAFYDVISLYDDLTHVWSADTCAPRMRDRWSKEDMTLGQCSVTSFLAQDIFGGRVLGIPLGDGNYHCFNAVAGTVFDLTSAQFKGKALNYDNAVEQKREDHFAKEEKKQRYLLLKEKLFSLFPKWKDHPQTPFKKLARVKQQLSDKESIELLKSELRGVLSVNGDGGYPYGMPMDHYYNEDDGKIYFHTGKSGHRAEALRKSSKASYCVIDKGTQKENGWALDFKSVIVFGTVELIEDQDRIRETAYLLSRKFTDDEEYIKDEIKRFAESTLLLAMTPEYITGKSVNES